MSDTEQREKNGDRLHEKPRRASYCHVWLPPTPVTETDPHTAESKFYSHRFLEVVKENLVMIPEYSDRWVLCFDKWLGQVAPSARRPRDRSSKTNMRLPPPFSSPWCRILRRCMVVLHKR